METVELDSDSEVYTLSNLQHDTEYIVTVIPLYEGNAEGPVATARFKIGGFFVFLYLQFKLSPDNGQCLPCSTCLGSFHAHFAHHLSLLCSVHMVPLQLSQY